ncbi:MAG: hypothetical protein E6J41_30130 [Chloroflexi bacterium]|nr:MAG: hypothetical protein E6J41_30130 [Chloroflexota bacterium]
MRVGFAADRRPPNDADLEPIAEVLYRTEGVRSAAVVPLETGLAVAVGLDAPDATSALERARVLIASCARHAGLGELKVLRTRVTPAPDAGTA